MKKNRCRDALAILADIFTIIMFTVWFLGLFHPETVETMAMVGSMIA